MDRWILAFVHRPSQHEFQRDRAWKTVAAGSSQGGKSWRLYEPMKHVEMQASLIHVTLEGDLVGLGDFFRTGDCHFHVPN
jgi:hypothetical protein